MNYEPLIERDLDAIPAAAHEFLDAHSVEELWTSVTRFAVLAYAPSQHAKRAVMACRAAWEVHGELGDRFAEMVIECARYASEARQPWSEPPILEPPEPSSGDLDELRAAMREGDRVRAERWLSARLLAEGTAAVPAAARAASRRPPGGVAARAAATAAGDDAGGPEDALREVVHGDALLMLDTAVALEPHLGEKGRYALLRMPVWELIADPNAVDDDAPLETLIARAVEENGSVDSVRAALIRGSGFGPTGRAEARPALSPYPLARDYAQTLLVHALLPHPDLLHAVHHNLEHGESYADWSFA